MAKKTSKKVKCPECGKEYTAAGIAKHRKNQHGVEPEGVGRPKEGLDLKKDWQHSVLKLYEQGASDVEIKAWIFKSRGSFSNDLWDRWLKEELEFSETIKVGRMLSAAWWHREGRENLKKSNFNYTGWYMNMKNRFGWRDRKDITTDDKELPKSAPDIKVFNSGPQLASSEDEVTDIKKEEE